MSTTRAKLPTNRLLGKQFTSPIKKRDKKKTTTLVRIPGQAGRIRALEAKIARLKQAAAQVLIPATADGSHHDTIDVADDNTGLNDTATVPSEDMEVDAVPSDPERATPDKRPRRVLPDTEAYRLYRNWSKLLPTLIDSFLAYTTTSTGRIVTPQVADIYSSCQRGCAATKTVTIQCLYFDRMKFHYLVQPVSLTRLPRFQTYRRYRMRMRIDSAGPSQARSLPHCSFSATHCSLSRSARFLSRPL